MWKHFLEQTYPSCPGLWTGSLPGGGSALNVTFIVRGLCFNWLLMVYLCQYNMDDIRVIYVLECRLVYHLVRL